VIGIDEDALSGQPPSAVEDETTRILELRIDALSLVFFLASSSVDGNVHDRLAG